MTVIAWDGVTLAADKRASDNGIARTVTKLRRCPTTSPNSGHLMACTGSVNRNAEVFAWYEAGAVPQDYPPSERDIDKCSILVAIERGPVVRYFNGTPFGVVFEDQRFATGSGRDYAHTAMHLGYDAREAVRIACELDMSCGNGIDTLTLDQ